MFVELSDWGILHRESFNGEVSVGDLPDWGIVLQSFKHFLNV